jgi:hypothetical protein
MDPSPFDSHPNFEPVQVAWESVSGLAPLGVEPVDPHLLRRVLKPGDIGGLGSIFLARGCR